MKTIQRTSQFRKDVKRMGRRGVDFSIFKEIIRKLATGETLETRYRDHRLVGQYKGTRECNIEPDWLLIYEATEAELVLIRTGTHADLFR
ncbi:MAG: type II toxin-antitoxin system YafQ family toxin [Chloroflexi bacterium]|nr:type II toxin-antitoxin system YafQ family toxin [Chloroflexota bacterium]MBU1659917.1 type II toxin-antitoxin system YafQ family toxin [Chloroflexota bacterium]